jgi:[ribosomal protein S18]-alanine N-acetyltransferase
MWSRLSCHGAKIVHRPSSRLVPFLSRSFATIWTRTVPMSQAVELQLARLSDANAIAELSRDLIETGLGWSWTQARVAGAIRCRDTNVLVARARTGIAGFAMMHFRQETAHLNLFAVAKSFQRCRVGTQLLRWVEKTAEIAGVASITLETRVGNRAGRAFYRSAGFEEILLIPRYYRGQESAVRIARFLRMDEQLAGLFAPPHGCGPG